MEINADLKADPDDKPQSEWRWTTEFDVRNIGDTEIMWDFCPTASSDLKDKPKARVGKPVVTEAGHEEDLVPASDEEERHNGRWKGAVFEAEYPTQIKLRPGVTYHVVVARFVNDRLERGYNTHYFTRITSGLKYSVTVDPQLFEITAVPFRPNGKSAVLKPTLQECGSNRLMSYTISETLLPYQGLEVHWKYNQPSTTQASTRQASTRQAPELKSGSTSIVQGHGSIRSKEASTLFPDRNDRDFRAAQKPNILN